MRRLPETDLFRIAPLQPDEKRRRLLAMTSGAGPFSYAPVHLTFPDIVNVQTDLFVHSPDTPWETVERLIKKRAKGEQEAAPNLAVAKLMYKHVREERFRAEYKDLGRFPLTIGDSLSYWLNAVLVRDGELVIAGFDPRRGRGLTKLGRRFAFSVMAQQVAQFDELKGAGLTIFQFPQFKKQPRFIRPASVDGLELYPYDEIIRLILETYSIWAEVLEERVEAGRKTGTDGWWGPVSR